MARIDWAASRRLGRVPKGIALNELRPAEFLGELDPMVGVYASAMNADRWTLPGRRQLMNQHVNFPEFRAIAARRPRRGTLVGFAYGFRGSAGQWWYDSVRMALASDAGIGPDAAQAWMGDCMEIAEVHVHPRFQRRGIGTGMLAQLTDGRSEQTALLSTPDRESTARRLYRQLGFTDLLIGYYFPGGSPPYAIMGALLPLRDPKVAPGSPGADIGARHPASPSVW